MSHCVPSSELSIPSFLLCFSLFEDFFFVFFLFFIFLCWVLVAAHGIFTVLWEIFSCPQPCPDPPRTEILPTAAPALGCFVVACCLPQKAGMGRSSAFQSLDFMDLFRIRWVLSPCAKRGERLWALPAPSGRGKSSAQSDLAPCPPVGGAGESLVE